MKPSLFSIFNKYPNVIIAISAKEDGPMKVRYELENDNKTLSNRSKFLKKYGITNDMVVSARLAQENSMRLVTKSDVGKFIPETDGLFTNEKGLYLSITIADCFPIFLYNPKNEAIGLIHVGWKGLDKKIIFNAVDALGKNYKVKPENLIVGIGLGIGVCHFEVKDDVLNRFRVYKDEIVKRGDKYYLDLKKIAVKQLFNLGIKKENIEVSPLCTYCEKDKYFSYRRDNSFPLEAMIVIIGMN